MKYKVTLNDKVYEVEVEAGKAVLLDEYEACAPAPAAAPAAEAAPAATAAPAPAPAAKVDLKAGEPVILRCRETFSVSRSRRANRSRPDSCWSFWRP